MKKFKFIELESKGPALWIYWNRPQLKNALNLDTAREFLEVVRLGVKDTQHPILVLSGRGSAFSAGGDIQQMSHTKNIKKFFLDISNSVHTAVKLLQQSNKPVLAAIPGYAGGVAFGALLGTDIRIASSEATFQAATINIGLVANGGATYFLPRIVGLAHASEILLTGRPITAQEALQMGLINKVVNADQVDSVTQDMAENIASKPRQAIAKVKKILSQSLDHSLSAQLERERQAIAWASTTTDFKEGIKAFLEKRRPHFNQSSKR